jgi:para-nitrobenzyl esterase
MAHALKLVVVLLLALVAFYSAGASAEGQPIAITLKGLIAGRATPISHEFLGVPYAAPPVGALRWRAPQSADAWWPKTLDATTYGHACPQATAATPNQDEDCLTLNVFTPLGSKPGDDRPVVVYVPHTCAI